MVDQVCKDIPVKMCKDKKVILFLVHKHRVAHSTLLLFNFIGSSGSPGLPGPNGFLGDRGEPGLTGDKGLPGNGFNITGPNGPDGMPGRRGLPGTPGYDGLLGQRGDKGIGRARVEKSTKQFISYIFNCLFYLGVRGDDCGFCPPGTPGSKGDHGDEGKKNICR